MRCFRLGLFAAASFAFALPALAQTARPTPSEADRERVWTQSYSDIAPDPAARFGTLPNGMRYAIMRNATPTGQASVRFRIGSGSLEESDAQQGLAHFLEHMAFKGSAHFPGQNDLVQTLERHGLAFGADTNAGTSFDETVYKLDMPRTDPDTVDTVLTVMRDIASELALSDAAFEPERGVILSEERLRDSPGFESVKAQFGLDLEGQLVPRRFPIGQVSVIQHAPVSLLRDYYRANYRPERATLIAIGDFDPDVMEAKIKAKFSDWRSPALPEPAPNLGQVERRGEQTRVFVAIGAPMSVQVAWAEPYDASPDSEARRRRDTVETLGLAVLNRRLDRLAHSADPPFVSAASARSNVIKSAKLTTLEVSTAPGAWRRGLQATVEEQRRAVQYGVSQDELDREITEYRTTLTTLAAGGATRRTPSVADEFASSVNNQEVFTSPAQDLAIFERDVRGLTAAEVNDALRKAFAGSGPLVYVSSPTAIDGGEPAVSAAFAQAEAQPVSPPVVEAAKTWPYSHFGAPGRVVGRREVADLGVTFVRFANNVRLTVKPTQFRKDQILVDVRIGDGRLGLPKDRPTVAWAANVLIQGGTKQLSYEDIERVLASKLATAQVSVGDDAFDLSGKTRPADLDTQLQLLTAYTVDPGFRPEAFLRSKSALPNVLDQIDSTPTLMLAVRLGLLTHEGDQRWTLLPTREQLAASQPADVQRLLSGPLASGPIDVVVTGDVTVERAIQAVAATFGALPARPAAAAPAPGATQVRFPGPNAQPLVLLDRGRPDQAVAMTAWPTSDFFSDPARARALTVAEQVFASRLLDQVRVAEGATYSPATTEQASHIFPGYGFMLAEVETPPAKIPGFFADVSKIVADMRAKPPTPDEMERAKKPTVEKLLKAQQTNEYWLGALERAQRDPRELDAIRTSVSGLQAITAADVQRVSHAYLLDPRTYRVIVRSPTPAPGAPNETPIPAPSTTPAVPTLPARPGATPTAPGARTPPPGPTAPGPATPAAQPTPPGASSGGR